MFNDKVPAKVRRQFDALPIRDNHLDRRDVTLTSPPCAGQQQHYGMNEPLLGAKWSNEKTIPVIGDRIVVTMNGFGPGVVRGYFTERGSDADYQGVYVECDKLPNWYVNQCAREGVRRRCVMVFGAEIKCGGAIRSIPLETELRDAWKGQGNSRKITFLRWCREMADSPTGILQEAAKNFLASRKKGTYHAH